MRKQNKAPERDFFIKKPRTMHAIDNFQVIGSKEVFYDFPKLTNLSKIEDYKYWLDKVDLPYADKKPQVFGKIIGIKKTYTTLLVWFQSGAKINLYYPENEKILIVQGSCLFTIFEVSHFLKEGDFIDIPIQSPYHIEITSIKACKVLLERVV